jgi:hypothetical protein
MWDVAGLLPLITCDDLPSAKRLWVDSAFQAEDKVADRITNGAISVDLNAVGITVSGVASGSQVGHLGCSLFNNAATASLFNNASKPGQQDIELSAGTTTLSRGTLSRDSISLISCESPTGGRYVTSHTPSVDNSSGVAGGLWVRQSTGFPGYTNQPILGLQNWNPLVTFPAHPSALSWACTTKVFRNGELVGTATAQRGSATPQFVSRTEQVQDRGWTWRYSADHPNPAFRGFVAGERYETAERAGIRISGKLYRIRVNGFFLGQFFLTFKEASDFAANFLEVNPEIILVDEGPLEFVDEIVYVNVGTAFYNYSPAVGVIVTGGKNTRLVSPLTVGGIYRGPFFVPAGGAFAVAIPFSLESQIDPLNHFVATQFDGVTGSQWASLTQEEGSYLCVSTTTDACDSADLLDPTEHVVMEGPGFVWPPTVGSGKGASAQQTTIFNSFVIDKTPPPLFWNVFDDMTVAEAAEKSINDWAILNGVRSDEPIGGDFGLQLSSPGFESLAAPSRWTPKTYRYIGAGTQTANFDTTLSYQTLAPGQYSITATAPVTDRAGNAALDQPSVTFKVVGGTQDELRGRPRFEIPFESSALVNGQIFGGREYPVTQIDVVFADHVYGVTKRHFELKGFGRYLDKSVQPPTLANGEIPQLMYEFPPVPPDGDTELERINPRGITKVERLSSKRLRLTLDSAMQFPGSKWRLFFTPDKQVFWADALPIGFDLEYRQTPAFISDSGGLVGETQLWQVKFPGGIDWPLLYDVDEEKWQIPFGGVTYDAGDTIESDSQLAAELTAVGIWIKFKKPVQMACRTNWIVIRPPGTTPERIDIGTYIFDLQNGAALSSGGSIIGIGGVSSVTTEITEPESSGEPWRSQISASGSMWLSKTPGTFQAGASNSVDPFVPSVPASQTQSTNEPYSYWGLDTTIYPSTPRRLRSCKAPKSNQPQASVIHGGGNMTTITATLSRVVVLGSNGPPASFTGGNFGPRLFSFSPTLVDARFLPSGTFDADWFVGLFSNLSFTSLGVPNRWVAQPTATQHLGTYYNALKIDRTPAQLWGEVTGLGVPGTPEYDATSIPLVDGTNFTVGAAVAQIVASCGEWTLRAQRTCTQHLGLSTAAPNELVITISGTVGYNGASSVYPRLWNFGLQAYEIGTAGMSGASGTYTANLVLSPEQEATLASGGSVSVVADRLSTHRTWQGQGLPELIYAGRHVWTLSAS